MKKSIFTILLLACYICTYAQSLSNTTWVNHLPNGDSFYVHLSLDNLYYSSENINYFHRSTIVVEDNQFTIQDLDNKTCPNEYKGQYTFSYKDGKLDFTVVSDTCRFRANAVGKGSWVQTKNPKIDFMSDVQQLTDFQALGKKIATTSANIQPGDMVVVYGGKHTLDLMEAIAIEAQKQGGLVQMFLVTDALQYSLFHDVKNEYLAQAPDYLTEWFKEIDVWIGLPNTEDFEWVYKDVPDEKFALANVAAESFNNALNSTKLRGVFVTYPTKNQAANVGMDFAKFKEIQWEAVNADYDQIAKNAKKLEALLMKSKTVKITTPDGTDLSFSVNQRKCIIDDGIVTKEDEQAPMIFQRIASLPGGNIFTTIIEDSANGKVVVSKTQCNYTAVENVNLQFTNGKMKDLSDPCILEVFEAYKGDVYQIASFQIGLNPRMPVLQDGQTDFRDGNAAGMVYLGVGDNGIYGGKNEVKGNFSYFFPITNATVEIDGKVVVKDGKLQL